MHTYSGNTNILYVDSGIGEQWSCNGVNVGDSAPCDVALHVFAFDAAIAEFSPRVSSKGLAPKALLAATCQYSMLAIGR
jgi:hypothetical protein